MTKLLLGLLGAGVLATGGWAAASGLDGTDPARTVSIPAVAGTTDGTAQATTTASTTTAATSTAATTTAASTTTAELEVEDVSGPCDEDEHANDQRCTGAAGDDSDDDDNDRSGSNQGSDDDDRSGSNSGKG